MDIANITSTRELDEFGNISYVIRDGETVLGRAHKKCGKGYELWFEDSDSYVPVASVKAAREYFPWRESLLARPLVKTLG